MLYSAIKQFIVSENSRLFGDQMLLCQPSSVHEAKKVLTQLSKRLAEETDVGNREILYQAKRELLLMAPFLLEQNLEDFL